VSRMFKSVTRTWNPEVGCLHGCIYCWARELATTKLKNSPRYRDGFKPNFFPNELKKRFKPGEFVFVSSMGDLFGWWVPREWIESVLTTIAKWPETTFLLQTKNPFRFRNFVGELPQNVYLGTTIETTSYLHAIDEQLGRQSIVLVEPGKITWAQDPIDRYFAMTEPCLQRFRKFLSIEPIMDFDLEEMVQWISEIRPGIVELGADNYGNNLPEPPWSKVEALLARLREICPEVKEKEGLERLKERR